VGVKQTKITEGGRGGENC